VRGERRLTQLNKWPDQTRAGARSARVTGP
jgi:hypothetical protein